MTIEAPVQAETVVAPAQGVRAVVEGATRRIAPLWPLRSFVAVNPYLGFTEQTFEQTAHVLARRAGARMSAPRAFYAEAIGAGRVTDADLQAALAEAEHVPGAPDSVAALKAFVAQPDTVFETLPTVAEAAQDVSGVDWPETVVELMSRWASAHFDQGQAYWPSPWRYLAPYAAWRAEAAIDRTPEVSGLAGFREMVAALPDDPHTAIEDALSELALPADGLDAYLHCLLMSINGWASFARYHLWQAELYGNEDTTLRDLLAIRLVWEVALLRQVAGTQAAWARAKGVYAESDAGHTASLAGELILQRAFEQAYQRGLIAQMGASASHTPAERKRAQAAFCIDVRSEVFRRALESVDNKIETIGFAGFFGFPIEYIRLGETHGGAQCPVLLTPQFVIPESVDGATPDEVAAIRATRWMRQRIAKAWRMFKFGAVSCFGFVGPVGMAYIKNLLEDTFGWGRPVPHPAKYGLDDATYARLAPSLEPGEYAGRSLGMAPQQRLDVAEGVLRAMSLTDNFARVVLLVGHGSTTVNNPYATGLDCGACGGHTGEANARVGARVLNDPYVRTGLAERGIVVPEDTIFVAAQHDTTTDTVTLFDKNALPASHADDIAQIEASLAGAGRLARAERAPLLHITPQDDIDRAVQARSKDWSQVRPEWGLAGCAAFIVAPRERTAQISLGGRAFLHSYNWRQDADFGVLELIMTAPMVVASWINLQYYGSTVDNRVFGSGNKVLHNVVGTLGVLEGNGGDLRTGLPWQSVHDGAKYIHEPLRLNVMIEAPTEAITDIIAKHDAVRQLVDNRWLYLFALDDNGAVAHQYAGGLTWTPCK
ncbi:MAG: YbcC family protein [Anaerolineales bacterium]